MVIDWYNEGRGVSLGVGLVVLSNRGCSWTQKVQLTKLYLDEIEFKILFLITVFGNSVFVRNKKKEKCFC